MNGEVRIITEKERAAAGKWYFRCAMNMAAPALVTDEWYSANEMRRQSDEWIEVDADGVRIKTDAQVEREAAPDQISFR